MASDLWFTVEEIDAETFALSEYGHWENTHSYLLLGQGSAALIDTGMGIGNIRSVVEQITPLPVQVITTHVHNDHIGGHGLFSSLAVHHLEADWLEQGVPLSRERIRAWLLKEPLRKPAPPGFDPDAYTPFKGKPSVLLSDGDGIDLGGRQLTVIHTPGHSPGHICLHERDRGYLFTGDLIYKGKLDAFYPSTDPQQFAASVAELTKLAPITRLLPGHYDLNLTPDYLDLVHRTFQELKARGLLQQGTGIHDFGEFQIHL